MATTAPRPVGIAERPQKRKKEVRTEIWSSLLRQTREAQARSRTHALQHRSLIVCGGSPSDQRQFLQSLARPPPQMPPPRGGRDAGAAAKGRQRGELKLSNKYAYGFGSLGLFSPPQASGVGGLGLGTEGEEIVRCELHTLPEARAEFREVLRGLLRPKKKQGDGENVAEDGNAVVDTGNNEDDHRRPAVCVLLSWKEPWNFLLKLKTWLQLLAQALLEPGTPATDPLDVLKEAQMAITLVVQHTEAQEVLLREGYKEEDFDYISQCLRTAILPLHPLSAMVYTTSNAPPQQPGSALSEQQKVVFSSLGLELSDLSPKTPRSSSGETTKKEELAPRHEFMDRMAIVIPAGWDSPAFVRTLSETFSPEEIVSGWLEDLQPPPPPKPEPEPELEEDKAEKKQADGGAEVYESSPVDEAADAFLPDPPMSPSKMPPSAVRAYEKRVQDPQAHKAPKPPQLEVTTKPDQKFLAEMREHLQSLEAQDRDKESKGQRSGVSNTSLTSTGGRTVGMPSGNSTGALHDLGDVSFNVGGVSYDTITAEAAINALKRPQNIDTSDPRSPAGATSRTHTPKPPRPGNRDATSSSTEKESAVKSPNSKKPLEIDKLEEYFASLSQKYSGGSRDGTPSKKGGGATGE